MQAYNVVSLDPSQGQLRYGFYDLTISKSEIFIESVNYDGEVLLTHTVYPS